MHVISDYSTKIKSVIKSERHYKMWVVYSRHSFMVRTIYVFCFTTLWFLVIHWNVIFLLLPLALLREGCDVSWDIHTAAWDTVVCFNWPQWHWATVPTGATAYTSIPSPLSLHTAQTPQGLDYFIWITTENTSQWIGEGLVLICLGLLTRPLL